MSLNIFFLIQDNTKKTENQHWRKPDRLCSAEVDILALHLIPSYKISFSNVLYKLSHKFLSINNTKCLSWYFFCACMCEGVHGHMHKLEITLGVFCNHFPPYIWDKISPIRLEWLASKLQGSSCLCLPSTGVIITQPSSLCGAGNQNSGLPDCTASTLLATIFLDPIIVFHKEINYPFGTFLYDKMAKSFMHGTMYQDHGPWL